MAEHDFEETGTYNKEIELLGSYFFTRILKYNGVIYSTDTVLINPLVYRYNNCI